MITIVRAQWLSRARLSDPMDWAHQAPPSMGFSRKEHWSSCHALLRGSAQPRDQTQASCIAGGPSEPPGKPLTCIISLNFYTDVEEGTLLLFYKKINKIFILFKKSLPYKITELKFRPRSAALWERAFTSYAKSHLGLWLV